MSIKLDIHLDALRDPTVAQALADLMTALGRGAATQPAAAPAPKASAPEAPPAAAPKAPKAAKAAAAATKDRRLPGDAAERYTRFVAGLPERSQRFLELVEQRGLLRMGEAMEILGVDIPKAMGGITGSIGRWAPERGVEVPYETLSVDGERAWKWVGKPAAGGK
ncbi:MAG: hypothetical protein H6704_05865 [Myxococcales bacterium]|nr:hypothetical protein [Myxococcales bacterium]